MTARTAQLLSTALALGLVCSIAIGLAPALTVPTYASASSESVCPSGTTFLVKYERTGNSSSYNPEGGNSHGVSVSGNGQAATWTSSTPITAVVVKASSSTQTYTYSPPATAGAVTGIGGHDISNLTFCVGSATATSTATRTNTPSPSPSQTALPPTATSTLLSPTATSTPGSTPSETQTPVPTGTLGPSQSGRIAIFKFMCDRIGQQDTCNGRDTSLSDYHVDFEVRAGENTTSGAVVQRIVVTLSDNGEGGGNTGNGSQGRAVGAPLPLGTYTVCEVQLAYRQGYPSVALIAAPRPSASEGGSTGGTNQQQVSGHCIQVTLTPGTAELKFLDARATPAPTATATAVVGTATGTPVTPTGTPGASPSTTATSTPETFGSATPTSTPETFGSATPTSTPTTIVPTIPMIPPGTFAPPIPGSPGSVPEFIPPFSNVPTSGGSSSASSEISGGSVEVAGSQGLPAVVASGSPAASGAAPSPEQVQAAPQPPTTSAAAAPAEAEGPDAPTVEVVAQGAPAGQTAAQLAASGVQQPRPLPAVRTLPSTGGLPSTDRPEPIPVVLGLLLLMLAGLLLRTRRQTPE